MELEVVSGKLKCTRKETFEKVQCPLNYSFTTGYNNSSRFVLQLYSIGQNLLWMVWFCRLKHMLFAPFEKTIQNM